LRCAQPDRRVKETLENAQESELGREHLINGTRVA
jgi:hypothetical protein